jgi:propionyl-CoA carboxylase beta chain
MSEGADDQRAGDARHGGLSPDALRDRFAVAACQHDKGRLAACERLDILFDEGTLTALTTGDGLITAWGQIGGRAIFAFAQDVTDGQGIVTAQHGARIVELLERAAAAQTPAVGLYDSAGLAVEQGLAALAGQGAVLRALAARSGAAPHIALVFGDAIGPAAFAPAMADVTFMLARAAKVCVAGPAVLRAATGELATAEALGGASLHATTTGLVDRVFADEIEMVFAARSVVGWLAAERSAADGEPPLALHLDTLVPTDAAEPYDMRELVLAIADRGDWFELQPDHAGAMLCGLARIDGRSVGIVANQPLVAGGVIDRPGIAKANHLVTLCAAQGLPIVTLVDSPGLMPGVNEEAGGIVAAAAGLIAAYARADVPVISVATRRAIGPAWLLMAPRAGEGSVARGACFAWPSAEIGAIGAAAGARLLFGGGEDAGTREKVRDYAARIADPEHAVAAGVIDAVIRPAATRATIALALGRIDAQGSGRSLPHPAPQGAGQ